MTASDRFHFIPATPDTIPVFEEVRTLFVNLPDDLDGLPPEGREKALVLTTLEEADSWATSAVARATRVERRPSQISRLVEGPTSQLPLRQDARDLFRADG